MPRGKTTAQRGGTFAAPLAVPRACEVMHTNELRCATGLCGACARQNRASDNVAKSMKSAIDTLKTKIACDLHPILPEKEAHLMEKYDAADVTFFTAGGPPPVGAHAADLKRLKAELQWIAAQRTLSALTIHEIFTSSAKEYHFSSAFAIDHTSIQLPSANHISPKQKLETSLVAT